MRRRWVHIAVACVSALGLCTAGCRAEPPPSDRTVVVDLASDIAALGSDDLFVSDPSLARIVAIGEPAVPLLARAFPDERPAVRAGIVETLRQIGGPDAASAILAATRDPDTTVRYEALLVLGQIEDARAVTVVESALGDTEPRIRLAAASACATHCESAAAIERLVELGIRDESFAIAIAARASLLAILESEDDPRRQHAATAIRERAVGLLHSAEPLPQRARAALLVADIGETAATPVLIEAATTLDDGHLRPRAVYALGDLGGAGSVEAVAAVLDGPFAAYGYDALRRMAARGTPGAQATLERYDGPRPPGPVPRP